MKITAEMVRAAYIAKGIKPVQGRFNLYVDWNAEGGPEFAVRDGCGCAVSALVCGEKLTETDRMVEVRRFLAGAENHLGINYIWDTKTQSIQDIGNRFSYSKEFDRKDSPIWLAVKDLAG